MSVARKSLIILEVFFLIMMSVSGIYALTKDTNIVEKTFNKNGVSIQLQEYTLNSENKEIQYNNENKNVVPSEEISLVPKVFNMGVDCYIRAKVTLLNRRENVEYSDFIKGVSDNWEKHGEYYYYNSVVSTGSMIEVFNKVKIPSEISNDNQDASLKLHILVEAVQAKNFKPDYTLENPWQGIEIEDSDESIYSVEGNTGLTKVSVKFENNSENDIFINEDFFENFANVLPGDVLKEEIQIKNNTSNSSEYSLNITKDKLTNEEKELLKRITFRITNNKGKVIFEGNLLENDTIALGKYSKGETDSLIFEITIPEDAKNMFEILKSKIHWNFTASYDENSATHGIANNPKTGDIKIDLIMVIFFISAIGLVITFWLEKNEKKKEHG